MPRFNQYEVQTTFGPQDTVLKWDAATGAVKQIDGDDLAAGMVSLLPGVIIGTQGSQGSQGVQGPQGFQGTTGAQGTQGPTGNNGSQGVQGSQGPQGFQGSQGAQGSQGDQGDTGTQGAQGDTGDQGAPGDQGDQGVQGPPDGAQGAQGPQGDDGAQGAQGAQGTTGAQGDQGDQGDQGVQGPSDGAQGDPGPQGTQGPQGDDGSQGPQGEDGVAGEGGNTGPFGGNAMQYQFEDTTTSGDPGAGVVRINHATPASATSMFISTTSAMAADVEAWLDTFVLFGTTGLHGIIRLYDRLDPSNYAFYGVSGVTTETGWRSIGLSFIDSNGTFTDLGSVVVDFSPNGATGDQGDAGAQGTQGPQGDDGSQGSQGATGAQGDGGAQGAQGAQGPQGAEGGGGGGGGDVFLAADNDFTGQNSFTLNPELDRTDLDAGTALTLGVNYFVTLGANRTLTFSGTPAEGSSTSLKVTTTSDLTLTFPSSKRSGVTNSAITSLDLLDDMVYTFLWVYVGAEYVLVDTVSSLVDLTADVTGVLPEANGGTGQTTQLAGSNFYGERTATLTNDHTYNGKIITGLTAGATIAQFEAVYLGSGGTWLLADADGTDTYPARGLAADAYVDTDPADIIVEGTVRDDSWNWTPGGDIYLSTTAGGLTQTAPSTSGDKVQKVGSALTADIAYFNFASGEFLEVNGGGGGGGGGTLTLARFTALDNQPPAANFATFHTRNSIAVLDFDADADEDSVFVGIVPEGADFTTGITVKLHWMATTATSGSVTWLTAFERSNTDLDTDSFAAAKSGTSETNATSGIATVTSIDHSGAEIDGLTAGDLFRIKVTRDGDGSVGTDDMTGDAELIAVEIRQR